MPKEPQLFDPVALLEPYAGLGLSKGQVGTVVLIHGDGDLEVEFCDDNGQAYAVAAFKPAQLLVLSYEPEPAA